MRVGRPIPAPPQPLCDSCGGKAVLARMGEAAYPYQEDHGPVWICPPCQAWIGVRARSKHHTPLGRLADAALREKKSQLHDALEPLVAAKMRRDGVNAFEARGKAMKWLIASLDLPIDSPTIHALSLEQCEQALQFITEFQAARRREPSGS
ncbi:zinc-finger-containing protein [Cupriavidus sp. a3]|uniref:zinc-finger-containing protein n=1 Tax=Cupriavidus sp. a3 TaxID=3242158 RepID=UPI003D9C1596